MALPTTITGISTAVACAGPFKSSGGNYYFFGRDATTASTLRAYKATAPDVSWASVASSSPSAGSGQTLFQIAAYQVGDIIHIATSYDTSTPTTAYDYRSFDMSSDAFVVSESIDSSLNTATSGGTRQQACSIVVRSGGEVVAFYNGAQVAAMGNSYAQVYYNRRTGTNTWSGATQVSAGGQVDFTRPEAVLGASDAVHFFNTASTGNACNQRTLNSSNVLQTASTALTNYSVSQAISYNSSGTQKIIGITGDNWTDVVATRFDSGNTPTLSQATVQSSSRPGRGFVDGTTAYCLYIDAGGDVVVETSTDHGATWSGATTAFAATISAADANVSVDGNIYQRGSDFVIPYVVNDNGTLKYNEYVVRSVATTIWIPPALNNDPIPLVSSFIGY